MNRRVLGWALMALLVGGVALGQGNQSSKLAKELMDKGSAGSDFIQESFLGTLRVNLEDEFGDRADSVYEGFLRRGKRMKKNDVMRLLNGTASSGQVREWFGKRNSTGAKRVLETTVHDKDKRLYFGILLFEMIDAFGLDPSAEFCRQVNGARSEITQKDFKRLLQGSATERLVERVFRFEDDRDQKFMKKILRSTRSSEYFTHPLCRSMPIGGSRKYDKRRYPGPRSSKKGPKKAEAGGLPFDADLPPCPFYGENVEDVYKAADEAR